MTFGERAAIALALTSVTAACGGAGPLLHPAHVESEGVVTAGAGVSGQIVTGDAASKIQAARETTVQGQAPVPQADAKYRAGALAIAALAPGVTPWVSGRVGVGWASEAGITYTGRALRIDARHAFGDETWALSVGAGVHGVRGRPGDRPSADLAGLQTDGISGLGFDVPVIGGWRSAAGLVQLWGGGRFFYEHLGGNLCLQGACGSDTGSNGTGWNANRLAAGGVLGFALGFRHVFVALELDASYEHGAATFDGSPDSFSVTAFTIAPAGAVIGRFLAGRRAAQTELRRSSDASKREAARTTTAAARRDASRWCCRHSGCASGPV